MSPIYFLSSSKLIRICILNNLKKKEKEKKKVDESKIKCVKYCLENCSVGSNKTLLKTQKGDRAAQMVGAP